MVSEKAAGVIPEGQLLRPLYATEHKILMLANRSNMVIRVLILPLLLVWSLAAIGCVSNRLYRKGEAAVENPAILPAPKPGPASAEDFKLGFVEFDDMGELWEPCPSLNAGTECQLSRVLALIRNEKQGACATGNCLRDVVVVVFVHGWKNNASPYNESHKNLYAFKNLLGQLARQEKMTASTTGRPPRAYIGIYIAWRGQVLAGDLFATFWNRRDAASRIAGPAFSEAIYRIIAASKQDSPATKVIVVGHSFGARILENSISDVFVSLVLPNPASGSTGIGNPVSPADLIVYVNSANDSFRAKEMIELLKRSSVGVLRTPGKPSGPLFLSVTSEGDLATKMAFPIGQELSAFTKAFRRKEGGPGGSASPPQRKYFTRTPGHVSYLASHEIVIAGSDPANCDSANGIVRFYVAANCYELHAKNSRWNDSPYWVTEVPRAIIPDHSQVFTDAFVTMLKRLIVHYDVIDSPQPTRMLLH